MPASFNITFPKSNINRIELSGVLTVFEEIGGRIDFEVDTSKCSMDMKVCEKHGAKTIHGICKIFKDQKIFYENVFARINPPISCPVKPNNYTLNEIYADLPFLAVVPLDGYVWISTYRFITGEVGKKARKVALCMNMEIKITRPKRSRN